MASTGAVGAPFASSRARRCRSCAKVDAMDGSCPCGTVKFQARRPPPVRFFCHCTICQSMYGPPYADITACWRWNLRIENVDALRFERRAWFPSSIQRGVCKHCDNPVLGHMQLPYYGISFVGTRNWKDTAPLPDRLARARAGAGPPCPVSGARRSSIGAPAASPNRARLDSSHHAGPPFSEALMHSR